MHSNVDILSVPLINPLEQSLFFLFKCLNSAFRNIRRFEPIAYSDFATIYCLPMLYNVEMQKAIYFWFFSFIMNAISLAITDIGSADAISKGNASSWIFNLGEKGNYSIEYSYANINSM